MRRSIILLVLMTLVAFAGCDPGLIGHLKVFNNTDRILTVKYGKYNDKKIDTLYIDVQPGSFEVVKELGGLGDKSKFDCCPCHAYLYSIKSSLGYIKKDLTKSDNWSILNKSKLKKYGKEPVKCEFYVSQTDL